MKLQAPIMSFGKYIIWTAVAAGLFAVSGNLDHLSVPTLLIPVVAAILKGIATFVQNQVDLNKPK